MATPKPGRSFNPNKSVYMGPGKNQFQTIAKPVPASSVAGAFKKSFKDPQYLPGQAADSVA